VGQLMSLGGEVPFQSTIPGFPQAVAALIGLGRLFLGQTFPLGPGSDVWYWAPTRMIPHPPAEAVPIAEFPAFTFLFGDLHAHMIALPLALMAVLLAVHWARCRKSRWPSLLVGGLVIGALWPTNTWDYPGYLVLGLAGLAVGLWPKRGLRSGDLKRRLGILVLQGGVLLVLTRLLYLPYIENYAAGYTTIDPWEGSRTPLLIYLAIHGVMLFPIFTRLVIETSRRTGNAGRGALTAVLLGGAVVVALALGLNGIQVALLVLPAAALVALLVLAPSMPANRRLMWLMVGLALSLSLVVEIVVLRGDISRMNTVFKFYLQAWLLLAAAAGVSVAWVREQARCWPEKSRRLWWGAMAALIVGGALYLPFGVRTRALERTSPETGLTLDGMAFMEDGAVPGPTRTIELRGDYEAIRYMQDEIEGSPVIMEWAGIGYYDWSSRVSIHTGLPAVIGWGWHEIQQRATLPAEMVHERRSDVAEFYETTDIALAVAILERHDVSYVYVGEFERDEHDPAGIAKFEQMASQGLLKVWYDALGVTIYEVVR
jgi:YYY domain-containing protein